MTCHEHLSGANIDLTLFAWEVFCVALQANGFISVAMVTAVSKAHGVLTHGSDLVLAAA